VPEIGVYDVLPLSEPFSPERYIKAIEAVEKSGAAIGILDSGSHEWEGIGGVLDLADQARDKSGKDGLHNWRKPKMEHALFLQRLLRSSIPWIICLRAKFKTRQAKENGKTVIVKDDVLTPIQAEDFIFEATVHGQIDMRHRFIPTKISHPALSACLPDNAMITADHGRMLAQWCEAPNKTPETKAPDKKSLLATLRTITTEVHKWTTGMTAKDWEFSRGLLESWLVKNGILSDTETLSGLGADRLVEVITKTRSAIALTANGTTTN
jgi:hypothetical protein